MRNLTTALRVVVADHAPFMRRLLGEALSMRGFDVAGEADSTESAIELCRRTSPDALLLDLASDRMDGVVAMRALREERMQVPVILLHGPFRADHYKVVDALVEGALDFVERPPACDTVQTFLSELVVRIKLATELSDVRRRHAERSSEQRVHRLQGVSSAARSRLGTSLESTRAVVIIGSHGGCWSLANLIPELPPRLGIGTVVVEQLPEGFTAALADRLDRHSALEVREAGGGEQLNPGSVYLAPGGRHLRLAGDGKLLISDDPPVDNLRPRADLVVGDAVRLYGERVLLVLLSGTGKDGLDGAREVREHGGRVIVEAESSAIAFGTQLAAIEAKLADEVVPLEGMAHAIAEAAGIWGQSERRAGNYISTLTGFDQPA